MNTGDIWVFIGIAVVSFSILLKLPNRCWRYGRIGTSIFESVLVIAALFLLAPKDEDLFFLAAAVIAIVFAVVFVRSDKKLGFGTVSSVFFGVVQSVLSLLGGIALLFALGRAIAPESAPTTSSTADDFDPKKHAVLEQAEWVARQKGYINADDWATKNGESSASAAYDHGFFDDKVK